MECGSRSASEKDDRCSYVWLCRSFSRPVDLPIQCFDWCERGRLGRSASIGWCRRLALHVHLSGKQVDWKVRACLPLSVLLQNIFLTVDLDCQQQKAI